MHYYWRDTALSTPHVCWQFSFSEPDFSSKRNLGNRDFDNNSWESESCWENQTNQNIKITSLKIFLEVCVIKTFYRVGFISSNLIEIEHQLTCQVWQIFVRLVLWQIYKLKIFWHVFRFKRFDFESGCVIWV